MQSSGAIFFNNLDIAGTLFVVILTGVVMYFVGRGIAFVITKMWATAIYTSLTNSEKATAFYQRWEKYLT